MPEVEAGGLSEGEGDLGTTVDFPTLGLLLWPEGLVDPAVLIESESGLLVGKHRRVIPLDRKLTRLGSTLDRLVLVTQKVLIECCLLLPSNLSLVFPRSH